MAKAEHTRKKLKELVAIQECIDSQLCRSLERKEIESNGEGEKPVFIIGIPKKSPLETYANKKTGSPPRQSLDCDEAASALQLLDDEILKIARKN